MLTNEDALQEVACGLYGALPSCHARCKVVDISVDDDDRVVDDHSQRHDESGQRHSVQLQIEDVEQTQRDENGDGHCRRRDSGYLARHDEHHDKEITGADGKDLFATKTDEELAAEIEELQRKLE